MTGIAVALISGDIIAMSYVAKKYFSSNECAKSFCPVFNDFVEQEDFQKAWQVAEEDPDKAKILTSSIAYRSGNKDSEVITLPKNNLYTIQVLYRLGYSWPATMWEYVEKFIDMLFKLGFFYV